MSKLKLKKGMTLIEILVAIAITGFVGLGVVSLQYILSQNQIAITKSYKSVDDANFLVSQLAKEIRSARQSDNGAYLLSFAGDQEIIYYSDINLDGKTEMVRYYLDGTIFIKEIVEPSGYPAFYDLLNKKTHTASENIRNGTVPIFYYYNEDWPKDNSNNPLAADDRLSETKTIKIYLKVNQNTETQKDYVIESFAQIRSIKENL